VPLLAKGSATALALLTALAATQLAGAQQVEPLPRPPATREAEVIRDAVARLRNRKPVTVGQVTLGSFDVLPQIYERRSYAPLWNNAESVRQMVAAVVAAYEEGLDPGDYHHDALQAWTGETGSVTPTDPGERAALDLTLTDSLVRLRRHLAHGKVDPVSVDAAWDFLAIEPSSADAIAEVDATASWATSAVERGEVIDRLAQIRPAITGYDTLLRELSRLRDIANAGGWAAVTEGPTLRPGERDPRVAALRSRLLTSGELVGDPAALDGALYDEALVQAVRAFQEAHGLDADGVAGPRTLAALGQDPRYWIDRIRVNLERARWVRTGFANAVVVDIAGFDARYVNDGEILWQGRVQVGNKYRSTPVLSSRIRSIVLNPTWTVPPTILTEDIFPEALRDPTYVGRRGLQVVDRGGQIVDPTTIDWGSFTAATLPYSLRQGPGAKNPLGRIKFLFPNPHFVYLHDTPSRSLFNRADRAASSGCIRIERPLELAELLLRTKKDWTRERLDRVIASGRTETVFLDDPVPIYLLYWTVGVTPEGRVHFKQDVYDRDPAVLTALDSEFRVDEAKHSSQQTP
jgi:murein L,D-transpeptidase YcbB/YkuD